MYKINKTTIFGPPANIHESLNFIHIDFILVNIAKLR